MTQTRALIATEHGWRVRHESVPNGAWRAEGVLVLANVPAAGLSIVRDPGSAELVVTWGPAMDHVAPAPGSLVEGHLSVSTESALLLPATAVGTSLGEVDLHGDVAVVGDGLVGRLCVGLLEERDAKVRIGLPDDGPVDVVVDATGDVGGWPRLMGGLRAEGTLLALVPPWAAPAPTFDLYEQLHRRSLRLVVRRWHRLGGHASFPGRGELPAVVARAVAAGGGVSEVNIEDPVGHDPAWLAWR